MSLKGLRSLKSHAVGRSWISASVVSVLLAIFCGTVAFAAEPAPGADGGRQQEQAGTGGGQPLQERVGLDADYFKGYLTDTGNILTAPARWDTSDWITASVVTGLSIGLYTQDKKIHAWELKNHGATADGITDDAKKVGLASIGAVVGLGVFGSLAKDDKALRTCLLSVESFVITGAMVQTLKFATGRHRPNSGDPYDTWSGPRAGYTSFPSGDSSSAFAIASVVASEYDNAIVPPLAYTEAALISLSRVYRNAHWPSDVFVGAAIGYFTGKAVVSAHRGAKANNLSVVPWLDGKDLGVLVTLQFR